MVVVLPKYFPKYHGSWFSKGNKGNYRPLKLKISSSCRSVCRQEQILNKENEYTYHYIFFHEQADEMVDRLRNLSYFVKCFEIWGYSSFHHQIQTIQCHSDLTKYQPLHLIAEKYNLEHFFNQHRTKYMYTKWIVLSGKTNEIDTCTVYSISGSGCTLQKPLSSR